MVDSAPQTSALASIAQSSPSSLSGNPTSLVPVVGTATNVPDQIQQAQRQIEITGTLAQSPDPSGVVLNTLLGSLSVLLPQLADVRQEKLMQILNNAFLTQKPITVFVQPGNPPSQVLLLLPNAPPPLSTQSTPTAPHPNFPSLNEAPFANGASFAAIVLPPEVSTAIPNMLLDQPIPLDPQNPFPLFSTSEGLPIPPNQNAAAQASAAAQAQKTAGALSNLITPNVVLSTIKGNHEGDAPMPAFLSTDAALLEANSLAEKLSLTSSDLSQSAWSQSALSQIGLSPSPFTLNPLSPNSNRNSSLSLLNPLLATAGKEVVVTFLGPAPPNGNDLNPTQLASAASRASVPMLATLTGRGLNGETILRVNDITLFLKQTISAPLGSNWLISIDALKNTNPAPLPYPDQASTGSLQQLLSNLASIDPHLAQQVIQNSIPQPNATLPVTLLFFLNALSKGTVRAWLGNAATDAITEWGKANLLKDLSQTFKESGALVRDNIVGEWRSYPLPLYSDQQFHWINLYVHNQSERDPRTSKSSSRDSSSVRFVIDLQMTKLGTLQMDGLVRKKQLDIIVRSEQALPHSLHQELRKTYASTMGALDYSGTLSFQEGRNHWMVINKTPPRAVLT